MSFNVMEEDDIVGESMKECDVTFDVVDEVCGLEKYQQFLIDVKKNIDNRLAMCLAKMDEQ